jgi:hypothetical protein
LTVNYVCEGCGQRGATETLIYPADAGPRAVRVHRRRSCALTAREALGGRKFIPESEVIGPLKKAKPLAPPPGTYAEADRRLVAAVTAYTAEVRRAARYHVGMVLPTEDQQAFAAEHAATLTPAEPPYGLKPALGGLANDWGGMRAEDANGRAWIVFIDGLYIAAQDGLDE